MPADLISLAFLSTKQPSKKRPDRAVGKHSPRTHAASCGLDRGPDRSSHSAASIRAGSYRRLYESRADPAWAILTHRTTKAFATVARATTASVAFNLDLHRLNLTKIRLVKGNHNGCWRRILVLIRHRLDLGLVYSSHPHGKDGHNRNRVQQCCTVHIILCPSGRLVN